MIQLQPVWLYDYISDLLGKNTLHADYFCTDISYFIQFLDIYYRPFIACLCEEIMLFFSAWFTKAQSHKPETCYVAQAGL